MPSGVEQIIVHPKREKDFNGDPVEPAPADRVITECVIVPVDKKDDDTVIPNGFFVAVPPGKEPPKATDQVTARGDRLDIDGNVREYLTKGGTHKGWTFYLRGAQE